MAWTSTSIVVFPLKISISQIPTKKWEHPNVSKIHKNCDDDHEMHREHNHDIIIL